MGRIHQTLIDGGRKSFLTSSDKNIVTMKLWKNRFALSYSAVRKKKDEKD